METKERTPTHPHARTHKHTFEIPKDEVITRTFWAALVFYFNSEADIANSDSQ